MRKGYCCKKTCNTHLARKVCNPLMNEGLGELMWVCPLGTLILYYIIVKNIKKCEIICWNINIII